LSLCGTLLGLTPSPSDKDSTRANIETSAPIIQKIDPPNWWANLPSPVLLVHGEHLDHASFHVAGQGVIITKTQASDNGHWAFLWLRTKGARAQQLIIRATNSIGSAEARYPLSARKATRGLYQGFSSRDVLYLIMTDRFADGSTANDAVGGDDRGRTQPRGWHGGDLKGIESHLDYLQQLGVTTIWTTPVVSNAGMSQSYHGYGATDLYSVDPHFGTLSDYERLASSLHARGMKLVLDFVPNHVGVNIPWVADPPAPDWFHGTLTQHTLPTSPFRYLPDPHAAPLDSANITTGWFTDSLPDLNQENPLVTEYIIQNAIWWIETAGLDGLRLDTFPYVGRAFWSQFHNRLHALYPHLTTVGEVFTPDPTITSYFAGGAAHAGIDTGLDTPFDYPLYFTLRDVFFHGKPMSALEDTLRQDWLYPHPERLVTFLGNHDTIRFLSEPGATIANLKVAFGILATLRGMPQIYSGDEIAMRGGEDPDNRHDFPGGFNDQVSTANAFTPTGRSAEQEEVFAALQTLLRLRAQEPNLTHGQQQNIFADDTALAFLRGIQLTSGCTAGATQRILVIAAKNTASRTLRLRTSQTALDSCGHIEQLYPATPVARQWSGGTLNLTLPPSAFIIYRVSQ